MKTKVIIKAITGIFFIAFCILFSVYCSAQSSLNTGLLSYWKLDESNGNVADSKGSNTGTNSNVTFTTGKINNGAVFNGSSALISHSASGFPTGNSARSINFWMKKTSVTQASIWQYGTEGNGLLWDVVMISNKIRINGYTTNAIDYSNTEIPTNVWTMVSIVFDGAGNIAYYFNGSPDGTTTIGTLNTSANNGQIGLDNYGNGYYSGSLDEIGFWNRTLTTTEITQLYNSGNGFAYPFASNPTVTTQTVSSIAATTATGNGTVSSDGGATITERGICWNTSTSPTTANSKAISSGTTGAFTASLTDLNAGNLYYVRAYAINSIGISYGNEINFTTLFSPATVDWNNSNVQEITLSANRSFTFTNGKSGGAYTLILKQDATGGRTVIWPANIEWVDAVAPTLSTIANAFDIVKFVFEGTDYLETGRSLNIHH